jgi:S1-C subfamily serine protease
VLLSTSDQRAGSGATISSVVNGGPAAAAGITAGDTITSIDGDPVSSASGLGALMSRYSPGTTVQVGYTDSSGQAQTTSVQLASGPAA